MANGIFENIWKIMKENKFQYVGQINNDLSCNMCKTLMIKACHVPCGCRYCFDCITNYLDGKDKFCPGKSKFCQMKTINHGSDVVIEPPTNVRISKVVVKCTHKNCEFIDELSLIENHMRTCDKNPTSCPYFQIGCKNDEVMIDDMKNHLCTEIFCHTKLSLDFINNLQNEIELMKNEIVELKSENKHFILKIKTMKVERIKDFGKFEWKIENLFQQEILTDIYSESFYSHRNGYKMCLSVGIDLCGLDVYVGVYFHLLRGEFDNGLLWPFKHGVTIDIINQMKRRVDRSKSIKFDEHPNDERCNKPATERNDGIFFIRIHKSEKIILKNQMLIKLKINI